MSPTRSASASRVGLSPPTHTPTLRSCTSAPAASSNPNPPENRSGSFVSPLDLPWQQHPSLQPLHAAGASSSAVCAACSPGTYSGSAGACLYGSVGMYCGTRLLPSLVHARHTIRPVPSWWANTALSSLLHLLCKPIFSIHHPMILMIFLRRSLRTMHSAKQCLRNCIRYAPPRRCHCQPEEGHSGESGMTRCCRSTSMVVTFGVSASARESKAMWVVLCVRGIRLEAEWEALDRPLAFHSNSIQPFPPCALPPLLHPRLKAPSRSYPVRQLLLHHVPRWNVHRLHRCGRENEGAGLCHHKQGGQLVCIICIYRFQVH